MGHGGPSWLITLTNLRSLRLQFCQSPKILHALRKLQPLETLELYVLRGIDKVGPEFFKVEIKSNMITTRISGTTGRDDDDGATMVNLFPKLKRILFNLPWCFEWAGILRWSVDSPVRIMPRLEYLKLQGCYPLKALPDFLRTTPLKHLIIEDCPELDEHCREPSGKAWIQIQHVPDIQIL
ncbi:hypothetical protein L484_014871 [Morus notabilis]|uniref:Uncharacterized protein n=1 Tax=Morus notabilis TaxID=981085 RepID=W9SR53_9ROSA|nr:uncharacterized protein LOC21397990 [Morus notabilis]EXC21516.1 hypothetical protein L484_014871 [Morus notabilis]